MYQRRQTKLKITLFCVFNLSFCHLTKYFVKSYLFHNSSIIDCNANWFHEMFFTGKLTFCYFVTVFWRPKIYCYYHRCFERILKMSQSGRISKQSPTQLVFCHETPLLFNEKEYFSLFGHFRTFFGYFANSPCNSKFSPGHLQQ